MKKVLMTIVALMSISLIAAPVKSMRGSEWTEALDEWEPTALDYVQDGLVAHWDGIENDSNGYSSYWVDLVNGFTLYNVNYCVSNGMYVYCGPSKVSNSDRITLDAELIGILNSSQDYTVEIVCGNNDSGDARTVIFGGLGTSSSLFGRGQLACGDNVNPAKVFLRNASSTFRPTNTIYIYADGGFNYCASIARDCFLQGNFNGTWLNFSTPPMMSNVDISHFYVNRLYDYLVIRLYNRALSKEEILHNFYIDKARFGL